MISKIPKASTIRNRIHHYASKCGFLIVAKNNNLYDVFDIHMQYNVSTNVNMNDVVRIIHDEMSAIVYRNNPSLVFHT